MVVLATGVTATGRVLAVLADATMARGHVTALLTVLVKLFGGEREVVDDVVRIAVEPWGTHARVARAGAARGRPHAAKPSRAEISARKSRIVRRPEEDAAARTTSKRAREMGLGRSLTCVGIFADVLQPVPKVLDEEGESESRGRALLMPRAACERENRPIANFLRLHTIGFFNLELFRDYRAVRCSSARPAAA